MMLSDKMPIEPLMLQEFICSVIMQKKKKKSKKS